MDKILTIIKREYLSRVRSKGFIIGTALSPILMGSLVVLPALLARSTGQGSYRVAVLDQSGDAALYDRFERLLAAGNPGGAAGTAPAANAQSDRFELMREEAGATEVEGRVKDLNRQIIDGKLEGYLVLPPDVLRRERIEYHTKNVTNFAVSSRVRNALNKAVIERRMAEAGLNPDRVSELSRGIDLDPINERGERERGQTFFLAFVLLIILYITILVYGISVMRGVIEEKQSRIIEVLLSSVRPFQLMLGKLVGIGLVGLTQYLVWAAFALLVSSLAAAQALAFSSFKFPRIPFSLMAFFVIYFLLGYFLYATLYAMVGAMVSSDEDGQQVQMPVTMTIVIPMAISSIILRNPNSTLSTVMSLIPFFSPVLMFLRITVQQPPWWQIALSLVLLVITILALVWVAAKIYRVGVLMYGKRPTLPELVKWLRYT